MTADGYGVRDVESGVLTGMILEKQKDEKTGESKYRVRGTASSGRGIELVAKLGATGKDGGDYRLRALSAENPMSSKSPKPTGPLRCDVCGAENARIRRVTRTYGSGRDLLVIENIPLVSCPICGESYLTAETLHELERLKRNRHTVAVGRKVGVVRFAA